MIIVVDTEGQLCNRLWGFLPILHHHRLTGERVWVFFFDQYMAFFPALATSTEMRCKRLLPMGPVYKKAGIAMKRLLKNGRIAYSQPLRLHKGGCSLVISWEHRTENHDDVTRHMAVRLFRPTEAVITRVHEAFRSMRAKSTIVLGVHMRRGDYRTFDQGRFLYTDSEYRTFMFQIKQQLEGLGYDLTCLVCSDEPIDLSAFKGLTVRNLPQAGPMEDLYALSRCDLILGPPSTFSQWASYYGEVPLMLVWDKNKRLELVDFGVCTSLDQTRPVDTVAWLRERSFLQSAPGAEPSSY